MLKEAREYRTSLILYTDRSKPDHGNMGATVCLKDKKLICLKDKSIFLGLNKEILDVKLWAISEASVIATKEIQHSKDTPITVFCDSPKALIAIQYTLSGNKNCYLRDVIYNRARKFQKGGPT